MMTVWMATYDDKSCRILENKTWKNYDPSKLAVTMMHSKYPVSTRYLLLFCWAYLLQTKVAKRVTYLLT